jgi:hypothetical protein
MPLQMEPRTPHPELVNNKIKDLLNMVPPSYRNYPKYIKEHPQSFIQ